MLYSGDEFYSDDITSGPNTVNPFSRQDEQQEPTGALQKVAAYFAVNSFTHDHIRNTPQEERETEGMGIALAHWTQWDGLRLMRIFFSALEDANFHSEAEQVQEMIERLERE